MALIVEKKATMKLEVTQMARTEDFLMHVQSARESFKNQFKPSASTTFVMAVQLPTTQQTLTALSVVNLLMVCSL